MCADVKDRILHLVRSAVDENLSGLKNDLATIKTDLENRLSGITSRMSADSLRLPEDQIRDMLHDTGQAPATATAAPADYSRLREAIQAIERGVSQVAILQEMLKRAFVYCKRCALFVVRDQAKTMVGWSALGFTGCGDMPDAGIKKVTVTLDEDTVLNEVYRTSQSFNGPSNQQKDNLQLFERIGSLDPVEILAAPLMKAGRVAAVLYCDSGDGQEGLASGDAIDILAGVTGMSIDLIPLKQKIGARPAPAPARAAAASAQAARKEAPASALKMETELPAPSPAAPAAPQAPAAPALGPEEEKIHNEAKRFSRLLVSEIKLYNEAKVAEGRKKKDIYVRLKEDIERSRQMYKERYPDISKTRDYFNEELIATLCDGDPSLMGR